MHSVRAVSGKNYHPKRINHKYVRCEADRCYGGEVGRGGGKGRRRGMVEERSKYFKCYSSGIKMKGKEGGKKR